MMNQVTFLGYSGSEMKNTILTEAGAYPQLPTQPNFFDHFQTYTPIYYGHSEPPNFPF